MEQEKTFIENLRGIKDFDFKKLWEQVKIWFLIILGYFLLLLAFAPLVKGSVEAFQNESYMKWVTLGITIAAVVLSLFLVIVKKSGWPALKVPVPAFVILVVYSAMLYPTGDPKAFTLLQRPTEALLNPVFLTVILVVIVGLWVRKQLPLWLRIVVSTVLVYCASAFVYGIVVGIGLEEAFIGADFFGNIPYFFLQPTYVTIQFVFPATLFLSVVAWAIRRKSHPKAAKVFIVLSLLLLITEAIGFAAMYRNRVPNLFSLIFAPRLGVGEAMTEFVDPSGTKVKTRIVTRGFENERQNESTEFYTMALSYIPLKDSPIGNDKQEELCRLNLSVKDAAGKDVLFLSAEDFDIYQNDVKQDDYDVDFELGGVKTGQNVILLLDHSGSMSGLIDQLKLAAKAFVDLKGRRDNILLIPFGNRPEPQPISKAKQVLKDQIDNMPKGGGTGLYAAILEGYRLGEQFSGPTTMVVMTDGKASDGNKPNQEALADRLTTKKIRIYCVGLGTEKSLDETFLSNLAGKGGGKYFRTEDAGNLRNIYQTIGAELQSKYTVGYRPQVPPPVVRIKSPVEGSLVVAETEFAAEVPNAAKAMLSKVKFYVDDSMISEEEAAVGTAYTVALDPLELSLGKHRLKVIADSVKGLQGEAVTEIEVKPAIELKIVAPHAKDRVGDVAEIEADLTIRTDQQLSEIGFAVDGAAIGAATAPPYVISWDTDEVAVGEHEISAKAVFTDGKMVKDAIKVVVTKDMTIQFKNPRNRQELSGIMALEIKISDEDPEDPVAEVHYSLEEEKDIGTATERPFALELDASQLAAGPYVLRAVAKSRSGRVANATIRALVSTGNLVVDREGASGKVETARFFFPPKNVVIILDASNSMWGQLPEGSKIDIAKQVLAKITDMIPEGTKVALRVYGNQSLVKRRNCRDTQLLMPLSPLNREAILAKIRMITPRGKTPIAYSISQAPQDLIGAKGDSVVLLITDGIESCDGDPVAAAAGLLKTGIKTKLHVIGYDVGGEDHRSTLAEIAKAGGGKFFSAGSSTELTDAIVQATAVNFRVLDSQGRTVLKDSVGSRSHELKIGKYRLVVDREPPVVMTDLLISKNQKTDVVLRQQGENFRVELQ